jgi:uncharacterized membrane protein HdeD (DUF308 family)
MSTSQRIDTLGGSMPELRGAGAWFIGMAIAFIVGGTLAIMAPFVAGLAVATLVGWLLVAGGVMHGVNAFKSDSITRAVWQTLVGVFYMIVGLYFLAHPLIALGTLTAMLAYVLFFEAIMDAITWFATRGEDGAGWLLVNTVATGLLAVLIWMQWPSVSVWVIGTLVGAKLIVSGISRLMFRSAAREERLIS